MKFDLMKKKDNTSSSWWIVNGKYLHLLENSLYSNIICEYLILVARVIMKIHDHRAEYKVKPLKKTCMMDE